MTRLVGREIEGWIERDIEHILMWKDLRKRRKKKVAKMGGGSKSVLGGNTPLPGP